MRVGTIAQGPYLASRSSGESVGVGVAEGEAVSVGIGVGRGEMFSGWFDRAFWGEKRVRRSCF